MDALTLLSPAIAAASLGYGVYQNRRAYRLARQVALTRGDLSSPNLSIRFNGFPLSCDFYIVAPLREGEAIDFPTLFTIKNDGQKTAREVELLLRYPKPLLYGGTDDSKFEFTVPLESVKIRSVANSANLETMLLSIPSINPGIGMGIDSRISVVFETSHTTKVTAQFLDGQHDLALKYRFSWLITTVLTQADQPAITSQIKITVLDLKDQSFDETIRQFNEDVVEAGQRSGDPRRAVVFSLDDAALEPHARYPKLPIRSVRPNGLRAAEGYITRHGLMLRREGDDAASNS